MKNMRAWGAATVAAMMWSSLAQAQLPPSSGSGGGASGVPAPKPAAPVPAPKPATPAPAPAAPAPAPKPATPPPSAVAPAPAPSTAPAPPPGDAVVAPPAPESPPTVPQVPAVTEAPRPEAEADLEEAPRKKRRRAKRPRYVAPSDERDERDDDYEGERDYDSREDYRGDEELRRDDGARSPWRLAGPKFVLGAERLTSILGWSATATGTNDGIDTDSQEIKTSGFDVSILGAGAHGRNPFAIPRVTFDYIFRSGFSIGGAVGYSVSSSEVEGPSFDGSGTTTTKDPTLSTALFAPRLGVLLPASPKVAVWLRGGVTHVGSASESEGDDSTTSFDYAESLWDLSLDPVLVLSPIPHVAITLGVSLDIGIGGESELTRGGDTTKTDLTASSYGVTSGLAAMF